MTSNFLGASVKQYQLAAWPELAAPFQRMAYRRMLHQMSQRPMSLGQLARHSGLHRSAVQRFIDALTADQSVIERAPAPVSWAARFKAFVRTSARRVKEVAAPRGTRATPRALARSLHLDVHGRTPDPAHRRRSP